MCGECSIVMPLRVGYCRYCNYLCSYSSSISVLDFVAVDQTFLNPGNCESSTSTTPEQGLVVCLCSKNTHHVAHPHRPMSYRW
jgi:hypothetical protein